MTSPQVNAVLAWAHIFSTIGWMGTAMFLVMVLSPSMLGLSPSARRELVLKLFPKFSRYVTVFATLTLVLGVFLAISKVSTLDDLSPTNMYGLRITVGASLALAAYALGLGVGVRSARKIVKILRQAGDGPQQTPPVEVVRLQRRMRLAATSVVFLLTLSLVFMVAASRLP